ncbi:hypothetical protein Tco_0832074 [Tanacetum coccineum]
MGDENPTTWERRILSIIWRLLQTKHRAYRIPYEESRREPTSSIRHNPIGRTAKLHNDILMFQQHHEESLSKAWTRFKDLLQKVPYRGIGRWLQIQIQRLMEAHLALTQPTQVNKITTPCEIYSGPHDPHKCMENPNKLSLITYP